MNRFLQSLLIVSTFAFFRLAMMAVHELGYVANARLSGGTVSRVVLHPLVFSRTDFAENSHPLFVAWGGASWGIVIPVLILADFPRQMMCRGFYVASS
ncbi:MAG: hypothetical protein IT426_01185 [Pirellulales bacterium]|nr:hypothetical protein [Pirellulales bacterium]